MWPQGYNICLWAFGYSPRQWVCYQSLLRAAWAAMSGHHLGYLAIVGVGALQQEVLLPDRIQGAALDLSDLDTLGRQWAAALAALAEAKALLLLPTRLLWGT